MVRLIVRQARLATGDVVDIGIDGGRIEAIEPSIVAGVAGGQELDATGLLVLPGLVDPHVHFNEPGSRTHWEGWATGSAAAAAGGITSVVEMPLNADPPTVSVAAFDAKVATALAGSHVDFGLWGGVIPGNVDELRGLADRGVVGFKGFMSHSGVPDFPAVDAASLYDAMRVISETGLPLALHAESDEITAGFAARAAAEGRCTMRDYIGSRPAVAEAEAIAGALELAHDTGCPLHIVHISTARGVELVDRARREGMRVSCEVTPHHLLLNEDEAASLGAVAKCAPPLRAPAEIERLWELLAARRIDWVASDHSPAPPELTNEDDLLASWGGVAGIQSGLEALLTEDRLALALLPVVTAGAAATRLRLVGKGRIALGEDADLALVALGEPRALNAGELRSRHRRSPYVGRRLTARVRHTLLRGVPITPDSPPRGRLLVPGERIPAGA